MRKWFNLSLALIVLGYTSNYILACGSKSSDNISSGWKNIDNNTFTKITGVTGQVSSIDFTTSIFYAGNSDGEIYQSTNQQTFQAVNATAIPSGQVFSNLILDNNGYLTVAVKDVIGNLGGIYRTNNPSTALSRYATPPFSQPMMRLFVDKNTNDTYAAMENSQVKTTTLYKFNSNNTNTPTIIANTTIEENGFAGLTLDNLGNIYFVINNITNNRSSVFKYDIVEEEVEPMLTLSDTAILSITNNGSAIYLAAENINTNTSIIYQSINDKDFVKTNVKTDWIINQIIFDDEDHIYAGGINNNLYAGIITNNTIDNFSIISSQTFNNIYSLNCKQDVLIIGGQAEFSLAQVDKFEFTKK